jgi:hypothetical protein
MALPTRVVPPNLICRTARAAPYRPASSWYRPASYRARRSAFCRTAAPSAIPPKVVCGTAQRHTPHAQRLPPYRQRRPAVPPSVVCGIAQGHLPCGGASFPHSAPSLALTCAMLVAFLRRQREARTRGVAAGRSAQRACERSSDWRRGAAGSPDPKHLPGSPDQGFSKLLPPPGKPTRPAPDPEPTGQRINTRGTSKSSVPRPLPCPDQVGA